MKKIESVQAWKFGNRLVIGRTIIPTDAEGVWYPKATARLLEADHRCVMERDRWLTYKMVKYPHWIKMMEKQAKAWKKEESVK